MQAVHPWPGTDFFLFLLRLSSSNLTILFETTGSDLELIVLLCFIRLQKFFKSRFGERCASFVLPDTFGYSAQLPAIGTYPSQSINFRFDLSDIAAELIRLL